MLFSFRFFSMSLHCSATQFSFALRMFILTLSSACLYLSASSTLSYLDFLRFLLSSHSSSRSGVTHGFLVIRFLPRTSMAVSVTAVLNMLVKLSILVPSASRSRSGANFPQIWASKTSATFGSFSFSRSNLILVWSCFFIFLRCKRKDIMTSSWSLYMSAHRKLRVCAMLTDVWNRHFTKM